jgi:hypothetical protein
MTGAPECLEYRVAHLAERLLSGHCGELGVRAEVRGGAVLLTGTVPTVRCRDDIRRIADEELTGLRVHCDLMVTGTTPPDDAEELS